MPELKSQVSCQMNRLHFLGQEKGTFDFSGPCARKVECPLFLSGPDVGVADLLAAGAIGPGLPQSTPSRQAGGSGPVPVTHHASPRNSGGPFPTAVLLIPSAQCGAWSFCAGAA